MNPQQPTTMYQQTPMNQPFQNRPVNPVGNYKQQMPNNRNMSQENILGIIRSNEPKDPKVIISSKLRIYLWYLSRCWMH